MAQCIGGPEFESSRNLLFFISSFLFFPSSFSCFSQCSFVLILYMALVFFLMYKFFSLLPYFLFFLLLAVPTKCFARSCNSLGHWPESIYYTSKNIRLDHVIDVLIRADSNQYPFYSLLVNGLGELQVLYLPMFTRANHVWNASQISAMLLLGVRNTHKLVFWFFRRRWWWWWRRWRWWWWWRWWVKMGYPCICLRESDYCLISFVRFFSVFFFLNSQPFSGIQMVASNRKEITTKGKRFRATSCLYMYTPAMAVTTHFVSFTSRHLKAFHRPLNSKSIFSNKFQVSLCNIVVYWPNLIASKSTISG